MLKGGDLERVTTLDPATTIFDNGNTAFQFTMTAFVSIYETVNDSVTSPDFAYNPTQDLEVLCL